MIPIERNITIHRGVRFELTATSQNKVPNYDPTANTALADLKRTYAQNLDHYGYTYEWVDFATLYDKAELVVYKSATSAIISTYDLVDGFIALTDKSVIVSIPAENTKTIDYDSAYYELLVTKKGATSIADIKLGASKVDVTDGLLFGYIKVLGVK